MIYGTDCWNPGPPGEKCGLAFQDPRAPFLEQVSADLVDGRKVVVEVCNGIARSLDLAIEALVLALELATVFADQEVELLVSGQKLFPGFRLGVTSVLDPVDEYVAIAQTGAAAE